MVDSMCADLTIATQSYSQPIAFIVINVVAMRNVTSCRPMLAQHNHVVHFLSTINAFLTSKKVQSQLDCFGEHKEKHDLFFLF